MREVVIVGYLRTAQSRSRPQDPARDWLHDLRGDELLAELLPELLRRTGVNSRELDDFLLGTALTVSEQFGYGGRLPIFLANMAETVPSKLVDQQCGSSMAAIHIGFMEIATGFADIVLAGGLEHMTRVPLDGSLLKTGAISYPPSLFSEERYAHWDMTTATNMGLTAEKLAARQGISREEMDRWGVRSHQLAARAQADGFFTGEILPIPARQADGSTRLIDRDQAVRADASVEAMSQLRPVFRKDGLITAGNSSPVNAGAAGMLLMSREAARQRGLKPLASIVSIASAGVDPTIMGAGPVPAARKALEKANLTSANIDFWEINEAFCVVVLNCIRELGLEPEKINTKGGGIALGHPLGATGIRLVGTLARILEEREGRFGCAALCCGGGQGVATIIERKDYND